MLIAYINADAVDSRHAIWIKAVRNAFLLTSQAQEIGLFLEGDACLGE
jgi:hypothetical protein